MKINKKLNVGCGKDIRSKKQGGLIWISIIKTGQMLYLI